MVGHLTASAAAELSELPRWATLLRAPNPGPLTLDGTNTWVLRAPGARSCVVIDPGPAHSGHLAAVAAHAPVAAVLTTHAHPDHAEGVPMLSQVLGGVPVVRGVDVDPRLAAMLRADAGLSLRALPTPGHTADSVCFVVGVDGDEAVLTGDTILGRGTAVVAWPDGELGDYLESLRRLAELGPMPVLPGHGPALADCSAAAGYYLEHRLARLDQVRSARAAGAVDAADVVRRVYADVDEALWPAAEWSVRAQLAYLDGEDRPRADVIGPNPESPDETTR